MSKVRVKIIRQTVIDGKDVYVGVKTPTVLEIEEADASVLVGSGKAEALEAWPSAKK